MSREYPCVYHKEGGYCAKFEEPGGTAMIQHREKYVIKGVGTNGILEV